MNTMRLGYSSERLQGPVAEEAVNKILKIEKILAFRSVYVSTHDRSSF